MTARASRQARTIGVLSDTHGLLRPQAAAALDGSELILHAGDVGRADVLDALRAIAPVVAVRGNNDAGTWADALPLAETLDVGGVRIHLLHDLADLACDPAAAGIDVVVAGHSHRPRLEERDGVVWLNPGSAGPRRFRLPVSLARLRIARGRARAEFVTLEV